MISEFVFTPQVFDEIISSYKEENSLLVVALTKALKNSCRNNILIADIGSILINKTQELLRYTLAKQKEQLKKQLEIVLADTLKEGEALLSQLKARDEFLDIINARLKMLWEVLNVTDKSVIIEYPSLVDPNCYKEQGWLVAIKELFPEKPKAFCLLTTEKTDVSDCKHLFKHPIHWKQLLEVLFDLNPIVYDSQKGEKDYVESLKRLLRLSNAIAIVEPRGAFECYLDKDGKEQMDLVEKFESITLGIIKEKMREKFNKFFPNRLSKIVVIAREDKNKEHTIEWKQNNLKSKIEYELRNGSTTPCNVDIKVFLSTHEDEENKIVDRRIYFGNTAPNSDAVPEFRWGVSVSHYFKNNKFGGVVSLLSADDVGNFQKLLKTEYYSS